MLVTFKSVNCVLSVLCVVGFAEKVAYRWNGFQSIWTKEPGWGGGVVWGRRFGSWGHRRTQEKNWQFSDN